MYLNLAPDAPMLPVHLCMLCHRSREFLSKACTLLVTILAIHKSCSLYYLHFQTTYDDLLHSTCGWEKIEVLYKSYYW